MKRKLTTIEHGTMVFTHGEHNVKCELLDGYFNAKVVATFYVPILAYAAELYDTLGITDIPDILSFAEGKSKLLPTQEREGIVFKEVNGGMTFKAISNKYLLNEK